MLKYRIPQIVTLTLVKRGLVDILLTQIKKTPNKLLNNNLLGIFIVDQPGLEPGTSRL